MRSSVWEKIYHLIYKLRLRRRYQAIDRIHYLKRLRNEKKDPLDRAYCSPRDICQFSNTEMLVCSRFMGKPVMFYCDPKSGVEHAIIKYGFFGSHILEFMAELLSPESVVLDIGANIGAYSIPLAKAFPDVTVHAFEPNPYAVARFRRNLLVNRVNNIRLHEKALGEEAGTLEFYAIEGRDIGLSSFIDRSVKEAHPMQMQLTRLDDMLDQDLSRVSVIKIDVQGFESQVLRGATRLLRRDRPYVLFEHEDDNFTEKDRAKEAKMGLCRLFAEHGYEVHYMTKYDPRILFPVQWEKPLNGDLLAIPITAHPVAPSAVEI